MHCNRSRGEGELNRSILKLTDRLSELKSLITVVVIGKDKFLVKGKSIIGGWGLPVPKCVGVPGA